MTTPPKAEINKPLIAITRAQNTSDLNGARDLVRRFAESLHHDYNVSLSFQNIDQELENFPKPYPIILIAKYAKDPLSPYLGVVALKDLSHISPYHCEMKRLYVAPEARGHKLGEKLCTALMADAKKCGYRYMMLDSLERLTSALALYTKLGFTPAPAYCANPLFDVVYRQKSL